ncbi:MAG: AI-2E family transporter [Actinomycetota bacterium]|nr:AI-2E family transporter [Actinomycetota bacterium]
MSLTDRGLLRAVLAGFALLLAWRFAAAVATVVLLLAAALLLSVALSAPVEALHRRKVPRPAAVAGIVALVLAVLGVAGYLLLPVLVQEAALLASSLPDALQQLVERARELANRLGIKIGGGSGGISPQTLASAARRVIGGLASLFGGLLGLFGGLASLFTALLVFLFVPLYLTAMPGPVVGWLVRLVPPDGRSTARSILSDSRDSLLGWLKGRLFSMVVVGVLAAVALYLIGVPGALFLGLFSGLVAFVPIIGSVVGAVPPLLLAFAGNPWGVLWVLLAYVAIQQVESNLLTPLVMRKAISLHPVVVVASVTVAGAAFGALGALLAVPAVVVGDILIRRLWFERLEGTGENDAS